MKASMRNGLIFFPWKKLKMEMEATVRFFPIMNVQAVYEARRQQTYFPFNELKITVIGM